MNPHEQYLKRQIEHDREECDRLRSELARLGAEITRIEIRIETRESDLDALMSSQADKRIDPSSAPLASPVHVSLPTPSERKGAYLAAIQRAPLRQSRAGEIRAYASEQLGYDIARDLVSRDLSGEDGKLFKSVKKGIWTLGPDAPPAVVSTATTPARGLFLASADDDE